MSFSVPTASRHVEGLLASATAPEGLRRLCNGVESSRARGDFGAQYAYHCFSKTTLIGAFVAAALAMLPY
jgi:hypothetical protein